MASIDSLPRKRTASVATYRTRLATTDADLEGAQRLRFEVFNLELNEGLDSAYLCGLDRDQFDEVCDHLLVEEIETGRVVGTYRLQTGAFAAAHRGYYSEQEFDFSPFESIRCELVELGRACVHRDHRKMYVVNMLWRGVTKYAVDRGSRYLIGCSSLTSQDPAIGHGVFETLCDEHLVASPFRTNPWQKYALPPSPPATDCPAPPRLLRAYLSLGAKICGPPALDSNFKTIDFLTFLDLAAFPPSVRNHFL
jgi:putative hemolysin